MESSEVPELTRNGRNVEPAGCTVVVDEHYDDEEMTDAGSDDVGDEMDIDNS
jgi:hypothetical protein